MDWKWNDCDALVSDFLLLVYHFQHKNLPPGRFIQKFGKNRFWNFYRCDLLSDCWTCEWFQCMHITRILDNDWSGNGHKPNAPIRYQHTKIKNLCNKIKSVANWPPTSISQPLSSEKIPWISARIFLLCSDFFLPRVWQKLNKANSCIVIFFI